MKKFGLRFLSRTGKKPMICKKINKIKSSQKKYPQSKVGSFKSAHHRSREGLMGQTK